MKKMALNLQQPLLYLITSGETTHRTEPASPEFRRILSIVRAAVSSGIQLIQLREKNLRPRVLYELAREAAAVTRDSPTRLLVNDRADIALAAGCDGVHLPTRSIDAGVIRKTFGANFLIGASTHSIKEARGARDAGADFAVFGPVFATPSKLAYGAPPGLRKLEEAARELSPFPLVALGGITRENAPQVWRAGASGIAAIRLFDDADNLEAVARGIKAGRK
jgi:thiamine-phosphate pyrophosphorylase